MRRRGARGEARGVDRLGGIDWRVVTVIAARVSVPLSLSLYLDRKPRECGEYPGTGGRTVRPGFSRYCIDHPSLDAP